MGLVRKSGFLAVGVNFSDLCPRNKHTKRSQEILIPQRAMRLIHSSHSTVVS